MAYTIIQWSKDMVFYLPGATNFYGARIPNGNILLIIIAILSIGLYLVKISKQK